ncbi:MAG: MarR family transcriptional regulator [Propionibacteriaceae bacterium]|nr:MarR family transcriptional regulator [Propionibacteriaceae bacterium]
MTDTRPTVPRPCPPRRGEAAFVEDVEARLGNYVKQAEQALIAAKSEALRPFDLTAAQYAAMMALYYAPGQSSAQLARTAAVTPQTMMTILSKLEHKRLIERSPSKEHRKVLVTVLTSAGEALLLRADKHARAVEERLADALTAEEHRQARNLLRKIAAALRGNSAVEGSALHEADTP